MKKTTILISILIFSLSTFSQNKIIKEYNNNNFEKCLIHCNKEITKNSKIKQTAYLYKALIFVENYKKYNEAIDLIYKIRETENFSEFYKLNKESFIKIRDLTLKHCTKLANNKYNLPLLKKLSELYLYKFEFSGSEGTADYERQLKLENSFSAFLKYNTLMNFVKLFEQDITSLAEMKNKEILFLFKILVIADPTEILNTVYNEIFAYLNEKEKFDLMLEEYSQKYSEEDKYKYRKIGNTTKIKKTINYEKVKIHVKNTPKENGKSIEKLSKYLTSNFNEAEKVYAIYYWIEKNIKYTKDSTSDYSVNRVYKESKFSNKMVRIAQAAETVLHNKSAVCEGYSNLFVALCKVSNIEAKYVSGIIPMTKTLVGSHSWNIVKVKDSWYLIDVTWGGDKNFLAEPVSFNESHYTSKNKQLLFAPFSKSTFYKNVTKYAKTLNKVKTNDSISMFRLAFIYYKSGDYQQAITEFENYSKFHKKGFDYYYIIGISYQMLSEYEKALVSFKNANKIKPNNINILLRISKVYMSQKKYSESKKYLIIAIKLAPFDNQVHRTRAMFYRAVKQYDKALVINDSLVKASPKDVENFLSRSLTYTKNKQYDKALADCNKVLKIDSEDITVIQNLTNIYIYKKNYEKAMFYVNKLLTKNPKDTWALDHLSFINFKLEDFQGAYTVLKEMIKEKTPSRADLASLAWYAITLKKYDEAEVYAKKSIAIDTETSAWNSLALSYIYRGQYAKAEKIYMEYKDRKYILEDEYDTYGDFFLKWIDYLSKRNLYHKDFEKAKEALN